MKKPFISLVLLCLCLSPFPALGQTAVPAAENPADPGFHLVVCDGPDLPANLLAEEEARLGREYIPCNFAGVMIQIQRLLNVAVVIGVLAAIAGFSYAGYLYITGTPANRTKAHAIFPKVGIGFILVLSAWFIVYQLLSWLGSDSGFTTLLGSP